MIVKLKEPVMFAGQEITELDICEKVKAKHWRGIPMRNPMLFDDLLKMAAKLSGQPDLVIDELCTDDMAAVVAAVSDFLSGGPVTGSTA